MESSRSGSGEEVVQSSLITNTAASVMELNLRSMIGEADPPSRRDSSPSTRWVASPLFPSTAGGGGGGSVIRDVGQGSAPPSPGMLGLMDRSRVGLE